MSDDLLNALVMRGQVTGNPELDDNGNHTFRLLLAAERTGTIPAVADSVSPWEATTDLQAAVTATAGALLPSLQELRQRWQPVAGDGSWQQVAPSLVLGWLGGHVGALQLLRASDLSTAAADLNSNDLARSVVLSFLRVSENNGVAHLLGGPFASGWLVRQVLNQPQVLSTLGSADEKGELLMYTSEPLQLLNAFKEVNRKAFYPSTYLLTLPVLSAASLQAMAEPLAVVTKQLAAAWPRLVELVAQSVSGELTPAQWLHFFAYCGGVMANVWLEAELLPPVVPLQTQERRGWFRKRQAVIEQQPPCGLCFWRDVEEMWRLGQAWS